MRVSLALSFLGAAMALSPKLALAAPYAVERGVSGVVDLYDLSSVAKTPTGFAITEVVTSDKLPQLFGPVAYRVSREAYDCRSATYDIVQLREYDAVGVRLETLTSQAKGAFRVMPATASSEMYARFCSPSQTSPKPGLTPVAFIQEPTPFEAYRYGRTELKLRRASEK